MTNDVLPPTPDLIDAKVDTLAIDPGISFNDWRRYGETLFAAEGALQWYLGDWWNFGQDAFAMDYHAGIVEISHAHSTVLEFGRVARAFPPRRLSQVAYRISEVSWSHHQQLASIKDPEERMAWLEDVLRKGWSRAQLRDELARENVVSQRSASALSVRIVQSHYDVAVRAAAIEEMDPKDWVLEQIRIGAERLGVSMPELEEAA